MVAYSFKKRFVDPILWGRKDQTIRLSRQGNGHAFPGSGLQLFTGMRTKQCQLILRTVCVGRCAVKLRWRPIIQFEIDGERLANGAYDAFARRDGFDDFSDMEQFWAETHPGLDVFEGELIRWKAPSAPVEIGATIEAGEPSATSPP